MRVRQTELLRSLRLYDLRFGYSFDRFLSRVKGNRAESIRLLTLGVLVLAVWVL